MPPKLLNLSSVTVPTLCANPKENDWSYFIRCFENYLAIISAPVEAKLPLLQNSLGPDGLLIFDGLSEPKDTYSAAIDRFKSYFTQKSSVLLHRKTFFESRQGQTETATEFACRLRRLAAECKFSAGEKELLRDIFVFGIYNDILGERLLAEDPATLTFEAALLKAEAFERAKKERGSAKVCSAATSRPEPEKPASTPTTPRRTQTNSHSHEKGKVKCFRCGNTSHKANFPNCPAKNAVCHLCAKKGHFKSQCKSQFRVHTVQEVPSSPNDTGNVDIFAVGQGNKRSIFINGQSVSAIIDTGAEISVIPRDVLIQKSISSLSDIAPCNIKTITVYGGSKLQVLGEVNCTCRYGDKEVQTTLFVIDTDDSNILLSSDLCAKLDLLQELIPDVAQASVETFEHPIFSGIGKVDEFDFQIHLKDDAKPVAHLPRRCAPGVLTKINAEIENLLSQDIIEPASDFKWCSPVVPVFKKNGQLRICTDFRSLNKSIVRHPHQIPSLEDLTSNLQGSEFFSCLDAKSGYHQIPVHPDSKHLLTFCVPNGCFRYKRMPFGISTAPEVYQSIMQKILQGIDGCHVYFDDVLVVGKTIQEHDERLRLVIQKLYDAGIRLNKDKSSIRQRSVVFLGHEFSSNGIAPHTEKQAALSSFPKPVTKDQMRSFLGLASYIGQKFVREYASIAAPLYDMIHSDDSFSWNSERETSFFKLRKCISECQTLTFFDSSKPVLIQTDASKVGISGVLMQEGKIVFLASRKLNPTEQRYSQIEREFLAIVFSLHRFRNFLFGTDFHVQTDNRSLTYFFKRSIDSLPLRIQRWMLTLQPFHFSIQHIEAKRNTIADTLSRSPTNDLTVTNEEICEYTAFFLNQSIVPLSSREIAMHTSQNDQLKKVKDMIDQNWPASAKKSCPQFYNIRHELALVKQDDHFLISMRDKTVIPESLRTTVLELAHEGHISVCKMKDILRARVYWPGMADDINDFVGRCPICLKHSALNSKAPLIPVADSVKIPWEKIALDITGPSDRTENKIVFTVIDYYSRYPFACIISSSSSQQVIEKLIQIFAKFGFPSEIVSDNGTCFTSQEFQDFLTSLGIKHCRSSVYFPSSNGLVERFHSTLKSHTDKLLSQKFSFTVALEQALFDIRSLPHEGTGKSPFFLMFGREMNTKLSQLSISKLRSYSCQQKQYKKIYKNKDFRHKAKYIHFRPGDPVTFRRGRDDKYVHNGTILRPAGSGCWMIRDVRDQTVKVNQRFIRWRPPSVPVPDPTTNRSSEAYDSHNSSSAIPDVNVQRYPQRHRAPPDYFY